jgi:ribosome maturation factor RimP
MLQKGVGFPAPSIFEKECCKTFMKNQVEQSVFTEIEPIVTELGYELVEVEYAEKENEMHLTVFIHKNEGITLDDCQLVANALDEPLDKLNPTNDEHYYFNVSSVGLDRPLKTKNDFLRNVGKEIDVTITAGEKQKTLQGVLKEVTDDTLLINAKGKITTIKQNDVVVATPTIKF